MCLIREFVFNRVDLNLIVLRVWEVGGVIGRKLVVFSL